MHRRFATSTIICGAIACASVLSLSGHAQQRERVAWQAPGAAVSFAGSYSAVTEREYHRIADQESFNELWTRHAGEKVERDSYGDIVAPEIDFDEFMVIAIFNGEGWNTRSMILVETADIKGELHIRFDASTYQTADLEIKELVIEGEVTPEKVEEATLRDVQQTDAERERTKHEDRNYTTAYGIFVLPKATRTIVLIENVQGIIGEPPIWEEKHRFDVVQE